MPGACPPRRRPLLAAAACALVVLFLHARDAGANACCIMGLCFDITPQLCLAVPGLPIPGANCPDTPFPCLGSGPYGACCGLPLCGYGPEPACIGLGGAYEGDGVLCTSDPCGSNPTGACCVAPPVGCQDLSNANCQLAGGTYRGDGSVCTPDPCPVAQTGACCLGSPTGCQVMTMADCLAAAADYRGDGSTCTPDPCVCDLALIVAIRNLRAVKAAADVRLTWQQDTNANGYNLWYVTDKIKIPASRQEPTSVAVCSNVSASPCVHRNGVAGVAGTLLHYNTIGVCDGTEAPL